MVTTVKLAFESEKVYLWHYLLHLKHSRRHICVEKQQHLCGKTGIEHLDVFKTI